MRGEITVFDAATGEGEIAGDDFVRYGFSAADARSPAALRNGLRVDFVVSEDGRAREIRRLVSGGDAATRNDRDFELGRVIQRTFAAIARNWAVFFGGAALIVGIPSLIMTWGQLNMTLAVQGVRASGPVVLAFGFGFLLLVVGYFIFQAMVLKAAINGFSGKTTTFGSAFRTGLSKAAPLFGLAILMSLGLAVGYLLLIVPGVFLSVLWCVAAPALVAEKRGVFESFTRSADLTRGYRWPVLGLLVVYVVLSWIVSIVAAGVGFALYGVADPASTAPAMMFVNAVVNTLSAVVGAAGAASLYYELRTAKEGAGADELAAVFD